MKYMLLINTGNGSSEWDQLSEDQQKARDG